MIVAIVGLTVRDGRAAEALSILRPLVGATLAEGRCRSCRLWREVDAPERLLLVEEWDTPGDMEHHFRSSLYQRVLAAVETGCAPPEIRFLQVAGERGLEWVEQTRTGSTL